ncbi:MAG: hypothetical protein KDK71_10645, partial [Chlamydiia bacterium]|nr:hypothetical protein [Chlamydiia bacterium]
MGQEVKTDPNCFEVKSAQIKSDLEKITQKFSQKADKGILKEWDRLMLSLEPKFIYQRNVAHLVKLSYSIYFIRKKLARNLTLFPFKDHFDVRIFSSSLSFPFGFKPTLSLLTHAYLKNKYELFDEEQIFCMIKKHLPDVELVKDSVYTIHLAQKGIKTLYFEVSKTSGLPFYPSEINTLQTLLKQEIRFSVEELTPRLFMVRNEEEI